MNLISFDQSTTCVGYAIFENEKLVQFGSFYPSNNKNADIRINEISNFLRKVINTVPNIDIILLEDIQLQTSINGKNFVNYGNNVLTFKILAKLQGALINTCISENIKYEVISPSHWKKGIGIKSKYRRDQKKEAMELVDEIFGENAAEDEADAICIGANYIKENHA